MEHPLGRPRRYDPSMTFVKYFAMPLTIIVIGVVYWFFSYEAAGTAMLVLFGVAMGILGWILVPTFDDVGPTAPVDEDWHESR
jgi:hypothetical protein